MTAVVGPSWLQLAFGGIWWGKELRRTKSVRLIGTVPVFGWAHDIGFRSVGVQVSFGLWHCYFQLTYMSKMWRQLTLQASRRQYS